MGRADEAARPAPHRRSVPGNYIYHDHCWLGEEYAAGVDPEEVVACHKTLGGCWRTWPRGEGPFASRDGQPSASVSPPTRAARRVVLHPPLCRALRPVEDADGVHELAGMPDEHTKILRAG